jgi:hypothetical protein
MSDPTPADTTALLEGLEAKVQMVRTRTLDISFNELLDMHRNGELVIDPDYQRLFRWSHAKESRFIESLILELPIPPIFVIEIDAGKYELIDGLQRISSYLHFRGAHPKRVSGDGKLEMLVLQECDVATELNGKTFDTLPEAIRIRLKRSFVRVETIRKESDRRLRYYMFKRLNTGGEALSDQEVRNCTIRLLDPGFNAFLTKMAAVTEFKQCIAFISEKEEMEKYDEELVLRFLAFKNARNLFKHDVGDFMTDYMEAMSQQPLPDGYQPFDMTAEEATFRKTFSVLAAALGESSFSKANERGTLIATFMVLHYEAFTLGIQAHLPRLDPNDTAQMEKLRDQFVQLKKDDEFKQQTTGGGKNRPGALNDRIKLVEDFLTKHS